MAAISVLPSSGCSTLRGPSSASSASRDHQRALAEQQRSWEIMALARAFEAKTARAEVTLARYVISLDPDTGRLFQDQWRTAASQLKSLTYATRKSDWQRGNVRAHPFGLAEQAQRLVDQMRPQILPDARRPRILPGRRRGRSPTVEMAFELDDLAQPPLGDQPAQGAEIRVPAPVLEDRQQPARAFRLGRDPIDVEEHLRAQLSSRGVTADAATLQELAREIRSGHGADLGQPDGSERP